MYKFRSHFTIFLWVLSVQLSTVTSSDNYLDTETNKAWSGKFFPFSPGQVDLNQIVSNDDRMDSMISNVDPSCDDGKTNITKDWDGLSSAYSCYMPRKLYRPNSNVSPVLTCDHIPATYSAMHVCMNTSISYEEAIPTYGPHRSLWPRYGEYQYVPRQRWLHNLEHGAVVMLYHPCADPEEVSRLTHLVQGCLFRHIITPDRLVSEERPLVLVTWGCRLEMSYVHEASVRSFIKEHALHGSEAIARDGQYDKALIKPANIVSSREDSDLCPDHVAHM